MVLVSILKLCSGIGHIPDSDQGLPPLVFDVCTDSASGAWEGMKGGQAYIPTCYSSSCNLSSSLVKALATVAAGQGCHVKLEKSTWCFTLLVDMADA